MKMLTVLLAMLSLATAEASRLHWPENACLPAAMQVYSQLPGGPICSFKGILSIQQAGAGMRHAIVIYKLYEEVWVYDMIWGSRRIRPKAMTPLELGRAADPSTLNAHWRVLNR